MREYDSFLNSIKEFVLFCVFDKSPIAGISWDLLEDCKLTEKHATQVSVHLNFKERLCFAMKSCTHIVLLKIINCVFVIPLSIILHQNLGLTTWLLPISLFLSEKILKKVYFELV